METGKIVFKNYNVLTVPNGTKSQLPMIHFSKAGLVTLNAAVVDALGLKAGDCVEFLQDTGRPADWYLAKSVKGIGFALRGCSGATKSLLFNNAGLVKIIAESLGINGGFVCNMCCSETVNSAYPIITRSARKVRKSK